jgi:glutamate racemase
MTPDAPIGLFDSGVGGLTVFRELARLLPQEDLIYFGDTARLPYGNKSPETILRYSLECASFLFSQKIKLLIVACHTASAHALDTLEKELPISVLGMIQPGIQLIIEKSRSKRVAILGTASTILSNAYPQLLPADYSLFPVACPLFVPLVEERTYDSKAALWIADHYLKPLKKCSIDTALLACTHYPLLRPLIQKILGPSVELLEPALPAASAAQREPVKSSIRRTA